MISIPTIRTSNENERPGRYPEVKTVRYVAGELVANCDIAPGDAVYLADESPPANPAGSNI